MGGLPDLPDSVSRTLELDNTPSRKVAITRFRNGVDRLPKTGTVFVTIVGPGGHDTLVESLVRATRSTPRRFVWLVTHDSLQGEQISFLKERANFFAEATHIGTRMCIQVLSARNVYSTELFLPRVLSLESDRLVLSPPILPVAPLPMSDGTPAETQPVAPSGLVDLLEQKYHAAFDSANTAIVIFRLGDRYMEANKSACDMLGYSMDELRNMRVSDVVPPENRFAVLRNLASLRRKGRVVMETRIRRKNGRIADIRLLISKMDKDLFVGSAQDFSELRRSHDLLGQQAEDFRTLVERDHTARALFVNNRLVLHNHAFERAFSSISGERLMHLTLQQFFGKQNKGLAREIQSLGEPGDAHVSARTGEVSFAASSGDTVVFEVSASPILYDKKRAVQCSFFDVTARAHILLAMQDSEAMFASLVENSHEGISVEQEGKFTFVNNAFIALFGYSSAKDVIGKEATLIGIRSAKGRKGQSKAEDQAVSVEETGFAQRNDGTSAVVRFRRVPSVIHGRPATVTFYRDVSVEKESTDSLERHIQSLETVRAASLAIHRSLELNELYRLVLAACMNAVNTEMGAMFRFAAGTADLEMVVHEGLPEKLASTLEHLSVTEGICGYASKTREPLLLTVKDYPPYLPYKSLFESESVAMVGVLPLFSGETVTGTVILASRRARSWDADEKILLTSLGNEINMALVNAVRYEELKRSEQLYGLTVEGVNHVLYRCAPNGSFEFLSSSVRELTGHDPHEFYTVKNMWRDLIHPDDRPTYSQRISSQSRDANVLDVEYRYLPKGKAAYRWVHDSLKYARDNDGQVLSITGTLTDITAQKTSDENVTRSEGLKGDILNSIQEGIFALDSRLQYLEWNQTMARITGITRGQVIGQSLDKAMPTVPKPELRRILERALAGESISSEEMPFPVAGADQDRFFWSQYGPLRDSDGVIKGVVGIVTDVTSRRQLEREVRESEETLRNVIDTMGDALTICDLQGRVWEANSEFSRLTGYSRKEVLGMEFPYPWVLEEDMPKYLEWIAALREKNYLRDFDMTWKTKGGHRVAMSMSTTLLRTALGEPVAMLNISRDISERKHLVLELERKAKENAQLYQEVQAQVGRITSLYELGKSLTGTLDTLTLLDIVYETVSKAFPIDQFSYSVYSADQRLLNPIYDVVDGRRNFDKGGISAKQRVVAPGTFLWEVLTDGKSFAGPSPIESGSDTSLLVVPMKSKETVVGMLTVMKRVSDVYSDTHLRLLESIANLTEIAMEKAMLYEDTVNKAHEIEERNKELDDFTYVVSHDLKEPLISIEGYSKILLKDYQDVVDQDGKEYLATVVQASTNMKSLIDDLLVLSRLGHVRESADLVPSGEVITEVLYNIQFTLRAKNVSLSVAPNMPTVRYNRTQLGVVFLNLISNAMKFNDKPNPRIDISFREEEGQFIFSVADNGIGIDEKYHERIFMIFQRLQRKEEFEGTGAGLTIVRKIIENHHGRIWVDSTVGEGTTFSFTIPK